MQTIGTPAPIKKTLNDSGIYDSVLNSFLSQSKTSTSSSGSGDISLTDPLIQKAANQTFTPQVLRENTEKILDSTYVWLNGGTQLPDFKLDLSSYKTSFASNVATNLETSLKSLPICPTNVRADTFDPLTATCLPKGTTAEMAATNAKNTLLTGKGFLDNPVITANDLKSGKDNSSVFASSLKKVPDYFSWVKKAPYILGGLTIVCGLLIVFLSATRAKGVRHISFTLLFVGALMLVFAWGANYLVTQKALPKIKIDNNLVLQEKIQLLAKDLTHTIDKTYWMFGGSYAALGVIGLLSPIAADRFGKGKKQYSAPGKKGREASGPPVDTAEPKTAPATPEPAKEEPKKHTISVQ